MLRKLITRLAALAIAALACTGQFASPVRAAPVPQSETPDLGSTQDVEAFMDGFVNAQLAAHHIAGATVAVVKDGQVILVKGYGYADMAALRPVDGQGTLFRPGSISKLFVWTAVMQQVEQGKIDLDADVNTYLTKFKIPDAFGKPVTILNLMTHTPGFEDSSQDLFVGSEDKMQPLDAYLSGHMLARVYPPGKIAAYSNYGATLAGYIVEEVSGVPFDKYVEQNILKPLGMEHTTFSQPVPAALKADVSKGYQLENGQPSERPFELVNAYPAGGLSTTAADMAKFMLAHLQDGELDGQRILKPETAQLMHAQAWTPSPEMEGMAHGFHAETINGQRIIGHGGDTILFHSQLALIPEQSAGLFISYNSASSAGAGGELVSGFMDRYYPAQHDPLTPPADFSTRVNRYVGTYGLARLNYSTPEKITGLFSALSVSPGPDNTILATSIRNPGALDTWVEVRPGVLKLDGGDDTLIFLDESGGQYQTAYIASLPSIGGLRSPWYATTSFGITLMGVCLLMFLTGILAAPVGLFGLRVKPPEDETRRWLRQVARWVAFAFCLLTIIYVVGFALTIVALSSDLGSGFGPLITLTQVTRVAALVGIAMVPLAFFAWRGKYWSAAGRIHYTLLALSALAWIGFELVWRLLG